MHQGLSRIMDNRDGLLHGLGPLRPRPHWGWSRREAAQRKSQGKSH